MRTNGDIVSSVRDRGARTSGFTLIELGFGVVILVIGVIVLINHLSASYAQTQSEKDRVFAYSKAQAMLSEIHAYVDRGAVSAAIGLDKLDDGTVSKSTLTITEENGTLVAPDHPISGNIQQHGDWLWWRRISVRPFMGLNNRNVRYVTIRIYKMSKAGIEHQVANLSSVVNSVGSAYPTSQVFDIYLLAVENIPGWWVFMEAIVPFVESAITDLESRNPGLKMRTHWITKASYGRNQVYRPYINDTTDSVQPVTSVYFYPGRMPTGNASSFYYVPDLVKGRMAFDGVERHGYDAVTNPYPYAVADYFNHAMRYPRERAFHGVRVGEVAARKQQIATALGLGVSPPPDLDDMSEEPTLRLFLEDLNTNPDKYRNALVINLHGELMPMPSLRNYSDPAKAPDVLPNVRVVVHPEELRTQRDPSTSIDDVVLRVYAYATDPDAYAGANPMPAQNPIAIQVIGLDLTDPAATSGLIAGAQISKLPGGVPVSGDMRYYPFSAAKTAAQSPATNEMHYTVEFRDPGIGQEKFTLIKLFHTPVRAQEVDDGNGTLRGLNSGVRSRLYNMEYVPACTEVALDFSRNLYTPGVGPKNTARWAVRIPGSVFAQGRFVDTTGNYYNPGADVTLTVRTRIWDPLAPGGDPLQTGSAWPTVIEPDNFSETYTWWADSATDVPITERSQFQGDPRHNPYKDLYNSVGADFANGYSWFHDTLQNDAQNSAADYPGLHAARLRNGWDGRLRQDVPRFFELLRNGLVQSGAVYTTLTGFSYFYMGHGNEIGYDAANGYPNSIPCNPGPWTTSTVGTRNVNNITVYREFVRTTTAGYWWGMPWLGELYPDNMYTPQWVALDPGGKLRGNLDAGASSSSHFMLAQDYGTYWSSNRRAYGTRLYAMQQRTAEKGSTSFFNIDNAPGRFGHVYSGGNGSLLGSGSQIGSNYNFPVPTSAPINRPFTLTGTPTAPPEFNYAPYTTTRGTAQLRATYYDHPSGNIGSGLVQLTATGNTAAAYVVVNGISNSVASGSSFVAKWSLLTMIHSFFETGATSLTHRIEMPPRVEIQSPSEITELKNPTSVPISYHVFWVRWDGQPYTAATPVSFAEDETELEYVLMYSRDNAQSWLYVQDDTPATISQRPASPAYLLPDSVVGPETFTWSTPAASFPEASYVLRVECYRANQMLHYSEHQAKIYISR